MKVTIATLAVLVLFTSSLLATDAVFKKVKYLERIEGKDKPKERKAKLYMRDDHFCIMDNKDKQEYVSIKYDTLKEIVYEKSKHPRWKTAVFLSPLALFSSGKKHWLTISWEEEGKGDYSILKLDKNNYREIIAACEAKTGREVEWILED